MLQMWTLKFPESTNICYISDRVACTIKVNIRETFIGNTGFLQRFMRFMDCSQGIKDITLKIWYLVRGRQIPVTLSPLWVTLGPMLSKVDLIKFGSPS